jgi:hypothetical protein
VGPHVGSPKGGPEVESSMGVPAILVLKGGKMGSKKWGTAGGMQQGVPQLGSHKGGQSRGFP